MGLYFITIFRVNITLFSASADPPYLSLNFGMASQPDRIAATDQQQDYKYITKNNRITPFSPKKEITGSITFVHKLKKIFFGKKDDFNALKSLLNLPNFDKISLSQGLAEGFALIPAKSTKNEKKNTTSRCSLDYAS